MDAVAAVKHSNNNGDQVLNIIYTNADCLTNKRDDLLLLLNSLDFKPSIIVITEVNSKINNNMLESEFSLSGYNIFSVNVGTNDHRGIIVYVDRSLTVCQPEVGTNFKECLLLQIRDSGKCILTIGAIYRSPNSKTDNNYQLFELLDSLNRQKLGKLLLVGDFNIRNIDWTNCQVVGTNSVAIKLLECLRKNDYSQHVLVPTRSRGSQLPSVLDLVLTNQDFVDSVYTLSPLGKSDHSVLHIKCNLSIRQSENAPKLNYNKGDYDKLRHYLDENLSFSKESTLCDNASEIWVTLRETIDKGIKMYIPLNKNNQWRRKESWCHPIDKELRQIISRKHRLWTRYQETRDINIFNEYKRTRNLARKGTRKTTQRVQSDIAKTCKDDPKKF